jgi:TatD DNase family protein
MIDSHCHLDHEPLAENLSQVILRSKNIGLDKILTISTTTSSFSKIVDIVNFDPMIYGTFGIHPHETNLEFVKKETIVKNIKSNKKIIGVGETGLDFYYNNSNKVNQINSFENHINASIDLNVPIIVHSRNAELETFEILNKYKKENLKILMHCFTGTSNFAEKLMKFNTYFSASGIITFKNSTDLQKTFKIIPEDKLLIETDSPFLTPMPMRGKKNEPSYIKYTLEKLAELKNFNIKNLDNITTNNFNKLFF